VGEVLLWADGHGWSRLGRVGKLCERERPRVGNLQKFRLGRLRNFAPTLLKLRENKCTGTAIFVLNKLLLVVSVS
jgi:hypothetical protein